MELAKSIRVKEETGDWGSLTFDVECDDEGKTVAVKRYELGRYVKEFWGSVDYEYDIIMEAEHFDELKKRLYGEIPLDDQDIDALMAYYGLTAENVEPPQLLLAMQLVRLLSLFHMTTELFQEMLDTWDIPYRVWSWNGH